MSKARLLMALVLFFLPALAFADGTDPQMDPNDCTGSFSLAQTGNEFVLFTDKTNTAISLSFTPLDAALTQEEVSQPNSCVANSTGGTITSLVVTTPEVGGDSTLADYTCPTATCTVSIDNDIVTYDFTNLNIAPDQEFGFIDTGFDAANVYSLANFDPTDSSHEKAMFNFATPEPGTLTLLGSGVLSLWSARRRRIK